MPSRIAFRFGIVFAALVILPFPFDVLPGTHAIATEYSNLWAAILSWLGGRVVGTADPVRVQLFASGVLAVLATISWSIVDREDRAHTWLASIGKTVLRFWLASAMLAYGIDKLTDPAPFILGEGIVACSAAALLFWRRTATIGAVVAGAVITNYAAHALDDHGSIDIQTGELLVAAFVLFLAEAPRVFAVLFGYATRAKRQVSTLPRYWKGILLVAKLFVVGWLVFHHVHEQIELAL